MSNKKKKRSLAGILDEENVQAQATGLTEEQELMDKVSQIVKDGQEKAKSEASEVVESTKESEPALTPAEKLSLRFEKKQKKLTMEETHTRTTFLLRNDLKERLEILTDANGRGFKTEFFNMAVEALLNEFEEK